MATQIETPSKTFLAGTALEPYRRVKITGADTVGYAGVNEDWIGVTQEQVSSGDHVRVMMRNSAATLKIEAAGSFSRDAVLYPAADGKVDDVVAGKPVGRALKAASGAASIIETILSDGKLPAIQNEVCIMENVTETASAGGTTTILAAADQNYKITEAFFYSRDTNAANVKLINNSSDATDAVAKGTNNNYKVQFLSLVAAQQALTAGNPLKVNLSAPGAIQVVVRMIPA